MFYKKYTILFIILIGSILLLSFLFTSTNIIQDIPLAISRSSSYVIKETQTLPAVERLVKENKVQLELTDNSTCYWIKPSYNKTHYLIEIREYDRELGECIGILKSIKYVALDHGIRMLSSDCLCGGQEYTLELEKVGDTGNLRITKGRSIK